MGACPSRPELEEFLTDCLPAESENRVLTHLESCSECQQILELLTAGPVGDLGRRQTVASTADLEGNVRGHLPSRIGQYTVIRELAHGGMGVVYLAEQANLKRLVALKVIRHGINATLEEVARFRDEAEAVARLQHPNIVQIHEVGGQDGVHYLALEYVEGGSLDQRIAGTSQDPWAAARLIATLARAVEHAHRRGILHRDLKPANILLGDEWQVAAGDETPAVLPFAKSAPLDAVPKITDFGLPNAWSRATPAPGAAWSWALPVRSLRSKRWQAPETSPVPSISTAWGLSCTSC